MYVKFWGTRGSLPRALTQDRFVHQLETLIGNARAKGLNTLDELLGAFKSGKIMHPMSYGGNTTCNEVGTDKGFCYLDSGSGIVQAGDEAMKKGIKEFTILQTHLHWDHILGLPFFIPMYQPGCKVTIYHVHKNAPEYMKILFNGVNFPVKWEALSAQIEFKYFPLYERKDVGGMQVSAFSLDHPGGSFGFRFENKDGAIAIGVDSEYKRFSREDMGKDLVFYQDLDVLVFDAQYEMDELASKYDWGHCSPIIGVDLALREGIKQLVLTHHDPRSADDKTSRMYQGALKHRNAQWGSYKGQDVWANKKTHTTGPEIYSAFDGMRFELREHKFKVSP